MGWRFLYSPINVLDEARVAFIGLNPGGNHHPDDNFLAIPEGSSYVDEQFGSSEPGESPYQRQVQEVFNRIGEEADKVLAGNLVPFRSPNWNTLNNQAAALAFGKSLWTEALKKAAPQLVIAIGNEPRKAVKDILSIKKTTSIDLNWETQGGGQLTCERGVFDRGTFIGLPHLAKFKIMHRPESEEALMQLFDPEHLYSEEMEADVGNLHNELFGKWNILHAGTSHGSINIILDDEAGTLQIGKLRARLDCRFGKDRKSAQVNFSWQGLDNAGFASGRGEAQLTGPNELAGTIFVHGSIDMPFTGVRKQNLHKTM